MILTVCGLIVAAIAAFAFLALVDQTGVPSKISELTGDSGDAITGAITTPAALSASFGSLTGRLLAGYTDPARIVVDLNVRRISGTSDPTKGTALYNAAHANNDGAGIVLVPDANQSGRSLSFHVGSEAEGSTPVGDAPNGATVKAALEALVNPVKPKFTIDSLIQALVRLNLASNGMPYPVAIIVDQVTGKVKVQLPLDQDDADAVSAAIGNIEPSTTDLVTLNLSGGTTDTGAPKQIFEGGATPTA